MRQRAVLRHRTEGVSWTVCAGVVLPLACLGAGNVALVAYAVLVTVLIPLARTLAALQIRKWTSLAAGTLESFAAGLQRAVGVVTDAASSSKARMHAAWLRAQCIATRSSLDALSAVLGCRGLIHTCLYDARRLSARGSAA